MIPSSWMFLCLSPFSFLLEINKIYLRERERRTDSDRHPPAERRKKCTNKCQQNTHKFPWKPWPGRPCCRLTEELAARPAPWLLVIHPPAGAPSWACTPCAGRYRGKAAAAEPDRGRRAGRGLPLPLTASGRWRVAGLQAAPGSGQASLLGFSNGDAPSRPGEGVRRRWPPGQARAVVCALHGSGDGGTDAHTHCRPSSPPPDPQGWRQEHGAEWLHTRRAGCGARLTEGALCADGLSRCNGSCRNELQPVNFWMFLCVCAHTCT